LAASLLASSEGRPDASCLSSGDALEAVTARQVVEPTAALGRAREAVPDADVLRAALCRGPDALVYRITVLRHDGRLIRVTVDAPSGKVTTIH
jgi:uncharacterized membrane protein YkoI